MKNKQYQFNLTEKQVDIINELIKKEFERTTSDIDETIINEDELVSLLSYIIFELGFQKVNEELEKKREKNNGNN